MIKETKPETGLFKSIEELENNVWPSLDVYPTSTVEACYNLRKKPLCELSDEELRLSLGQEVGIRFTLPIIAEKLRKNKLIECDFYPGDLLQATCNKIDIDWYENSFLKQQICDFILSEFDEIERNTEVPEKVKREIYLNLIEYKKNAR